MSSPFAVGVRPSTTRAILGLFQLYNWKDAVYLYDHEYGPEKLQLISLLGHRVLNLTLDGILKVSSAEEANWYLQSLDRSFDSKLFHVILDTDPSMAKDIIWRHVNDIYVRKKNFHFVLSEPTPEDFWISQRATFGAINVTTFTIANQLSERERLSLQTWMSEKKHEFNMSSLYYYDAALVVLQAVKKLSRSDHRAFQANLSRNCLENTPTAIFTDSKLTQAIKEINIKDGVTGRIQFDEGQRKNFDLNITEITFRGERRVGTWSNGILHPDNLSRRIIPTSLPLVQDNPLRIVTIISPPYMMFKKAENGSSFYGNERFEGYCKDIIDLLAHEMNFNYQLKLVEDGQYGDYEKSKVNWTGIIGEIVHGKADLAVADLTITGQRQLVVDFTDPYEMIGFSLVMKNPLSILPSSSMFFFLSAFTTDVWICIIIAVLVFTVLFHLITKFTGAPDSIESASGIWGRKHTIVVNTWFAVGTSMFQGTGVYPRSISSRVLSGVFWFFTLILSSMFIASITAQIRSSSLLGENNPQLSQLKDLSLESIILESVTRGWPKIGLTHPSDIAIFIKKSNLPTFVKYAQYLENNPDAKINSDEEGLKKVRESAGNFIMFLESLTSEYAVLQKPCDLVATHDFAHYASFGIATQQGSHLTSDINIALDTIKRKGTLGSLHRKWWIDSSQCKSYNEENTNVKTIHVFSGLLCVSAAGLLIVLGVFFIQYIRKNQNRESRRQQLSFEDMNIGQTFPTPPPELLAEPAPVLNVPEYDKRTLL